MAKTSMEIVMSEDLKERLIAIAPRAGKTVQEFAQEALYTFVEDYEDGLAVEEARKEGGSTFTQEEMEREFVLDNRLQALSKKIA
jgi:predicted DNA-binding protein